MEALLSAYPAIGMIAKVAVFLFSLSVLVFLHEGGHFLMARRFNVAVNEFAIGFGPKLFSRRSKKTGTLYAINAIPLGGYCAMLGEDALKKETLDGTISTGEDNVILLGGSYASRPPWERMGIIVAGPIVNLLTALVILFFAGVFIGVPGDKSTTTVGYVMAKFPAAAIGLHVGDRIVSVDGIAMTTGEQIVTTINARVNKSIDLVYARGSTTHEVHVKTVSVARAGKRVGILGFQPRFEYVRENIVVAARDSSTKLWEMITDDLTGLGTLLTHPTTSADSLSGPVGMARAAVTIQDYGAATYLWFVALLSMSLGVFNLLPFPALDGGRAIFVIFELLSGRTVDPEKEAMVHIAGFALIIALVIGITYHDILNIIAAKPIF